jgi:chromosome segregation ATPase
MSAAPPRPRQRPGCGSGQLVDLDQRRLRLLERSLEETGAELAVMEARWFHVMAEMRRLQRRLEAGASELVLLRERLNHARPETGRISADRASKEQAGRRWWWERWI